MVISKTPLRISFVGGGSDLASFYKKQVGAVVSTAIDKHIYITVNKKFDDLIRASYSITEFVEKPEDLKHELIREALLLLDIHKGIEITSISDIPSKGTGLGSSSTYTVGLLNALYAFKGRISSAKRLAEEACEIEIDRCKKPIGKQDQYAAAFGNLNYIQFNQDGTVFVSPIICPVKKELQESLLLLYTGITRSSSSILDKQNKSHQRNEESIQLMVSMAKEMKASLEEGNLGVFGWLLDKNWNLKKKLAKGISNPEIDKWYDTAKKYGAIGGKICGAGGGGFLLLYAPKEKHEGIIKALPELRHIPFGFEPEGSKIIYYGE